MQRFEREAQVLASLNHPNVAAIYGIEDRAIVMELVEGDHLRGPLPFDLAIEYARQIAAGLEAAHEKGVIHRDLKPDNIKIAADGKIKLLDFGLAKNVEGAAAARHQFANRDPRDDPERYDPRHRGVYGARAGAREGSR
jgi:serine/threonine protein kinase